MLHNIEAEYLNLCRKIMQEGTICTDRTGTGTFSLFGEQIKHDLILGFPLLTTKRVFWKGIVEELLWFLRGETNVKSLQEKGVHIWDAWANENGDLGPIYSQQWVRWEAYEETYDDAHGAQIVKYSINQIEKLIQRIREKPDCRRLIVSAWNPADVDKMALPPCHALFQFRIYNGKLSCQLYQRSADMFLGVPFNIASYSLLTHVIANMCDLEVGQYIHTFGDCHIYKNHVDQVNLQLSRELRPLPQLKIKKKITSITDICFEDFELVDYNPHGSIKAGVSV